jgi:membrane protein implicated in regulation of membrane protease activity
MLGGWTWWIIAAALFVCELMVPGVFFLWLGLAAIAVALVELAVDLSWQFEVGLFGVFSTISLILSRFYVARRGEASESFLNRRTAGYVGRAYVLEEPIRQGRGKLRIQDAIWEIAGPDCPEGTWVKVTGVDGHVLKVEPTARPA